MPRETRRLPPRTLTYPDWSNPICKGLIMLIQPGFQKDVAGGNPGTLGLIPTSSTETYTKTKTGSLYVDGVTVSSGTNSGNPGLLLGTGALMGVLAQSTLIAIAGTNGALSGVASGNQVIDNNGDAIYCERSGVVGGDIYKIGPVGANSGGSTTGPNVEFTYRTDDGQLLQLRPQCAASINDGSPHFYAQTKDSAAHAVWFEETKLTGTFPGANQNMTDAGLSRQIGSDPADSQCVFYGLIDLVAGWNRVLSDNEINSLRKNPWQLFAKTKGTLPPITPGVSVQTVYPASDISAGNWTPSTGISLYATINESPASDVQYDSTPNASTMVVKLQAASSPGVSTGHIVNYRCQGAGILTVDLMQGATVIATWTHNPAPAVYTTFAQAVTSLQAANITDYTDLRLRFAAS